jgi:chemotaxis protein methyltransferase CheR
MIATDDLAFIQQFVLNRTGIHLTPEKRYLVETRLDPVMRELQIPTFERLITLLRQADRAVATAVIDAITTNETLFFRDKHPFELFEKTIMPQLIESCASRGRIRIWCAACSSGQEPYSLAMILDDMKTRLAGITVEIIATDISERILDQAREGSYSQFEVQRGLPIRMLLKHFTQEGTRWRINRSLAEMVQFRSLNLLKPFQSLGTFDLVMCRNVLIYFAEATKRDVLHRLSTVMAPDGYLMLGGAETVLGLSPDLAPHKSERSLYVRAGSQHAHTITPFRQRLIG